MPLLDHFHPPLSPIRHWEAFHARWAASIADALNRDLPPKFYYAEAQVLVGGRIEIDVAAFDERPRGETSGGEGNTATAIAEPQPWAPPNATMVMPAIYPDSLEVLVFNGESGPNLVAAIELISPGNKDRPEYRRAFAAKCASYLHQGIGLVTIDIVTSRQRNLHNELIHLMGSADSFLLLEGALLAVAYRPSRRSHDENSGVVEIWHSELALGQPLGNIPLALDRGLFLPLDLDATYSEACERSRIISDR